MIMISKGGFFGCSRATLVHPDSNDDNIQVGHDGLLLHLKKSKIHRLVILFSPKILDTLIEEKSWITAVQICTGMGSILVSNEVWTQHPLVTALRNLEKN